MTLRWVAAVLAALGVAVLAGRFLLRGPPEPSGIHFQVRKGASAQEISRDLRDRGLLRHPWAFLIWVKIHGRSGMIRPGVYVLSPRDGTRAIFHKLRQGPPPVRITFPEGWTAHQMAELLHARGITNRTPFLDFVYKSGAEGRLFPDTYLFSMDTPPMNVIEKMTARFEEQKPRDFDARAQAMGRTPRELVILASMIEREARVPEERPLIAGVFANRLRKRWLLESCATVQYALGLARGTPGFWKPRLTYKDLDVKSPYNTYRHHGLPPGPIGNPGAAALEAAAHPAQMDMMFFVADGGGTHRFSRYYKEHLKAKRKR